MEKLSIFGSSRTTRSADDLFFIDDVVADFRGPSWVRVKSFMTKLSISVSVGGEGVGRRFIIHLRRSCGFSMSFGSLSTVSCFGRRTMICLKFMTKLTSQCRGPSIDDFFFP